MLIGALVSVCDACRRVHSGQGQVKPSVQARFRRTATPTPQPRVGSSAQAKVALFTQFFYGGSPGMHGVLL